MSTYCILSIKCIIYWVLYFGMFNFYSINILKCFQVIIGINYALPLGSETTLIIIYDNAWLHLPEQTNLSLYVSKREEMDKNWLIYKGTAKNKPEM